jgi:hypothetical protein
VFIIMKLKTRTVEIAEIKDARSDPVGRHPSRLFYSFD